MVEGLRLSLRKFVMLTLLAVGSVIIVLFSIQSADSFLDGMDGMLRTSMMQAAKRVQVTPGKPTKILEYHIAATYEDVPEVIKESFPQALITPRALMKKIYKPNIFERPLSASFLVMVPQPDGQKVYVSQRFTAPPIETEKRFRINHQMHSILVGVAALVAFSIALLLLLRSVSRPVESLQAWAASLDESHLDKPIPDFRYTELNALATIIHSSLQRVKQTVEREREFVNHASHELRTPIAVVRSSIELLYRVVDVENSKGRNAVSRIDSAAKTMADLTETLLWLGRENGNELAISEVDVATLVKTLVDDLMYLLQGKSVSVTLNLDHCVKAMPAMAAQIVIGNVIRNAFQHTYQGKVVISLTEDTLIVSNFEDNPASSSYLSPKGAEMGEGFGIGLKLIDKLTQKLNWGYHPEHSKQGYTVVLAMHAVNQLPK